MSDFYAKPRNDYAIDSAETRNNTIKIYQYLHAQGFSDESIIGILGNIYAESGMNPWLWNGNVYSPSSVAYGLFQFYPGSSYTNATWIPNHSPNLSTTEITPGADPDDAYGQLYAVANDSLNKWVGTCWGPWSSSTYPDLYAKHTYILNTYGDGYGITINDFKRINVYSDAVFAFVACYERPETPGYLTRLGYAATLKRIVDQISHNLDILFLKRFIIDKQFNKYK